MTNDNNNKTESQAKKLTTQEKINQTIDNQNKSILSEHEYKINIYKRTLVILDNEISEIPTKKSLLENQILALQNQREKYKLEIELLKIKILESKK